MGKTLYAVVVAGPSVAGTVLAAAIEHAGATLDQSVVLFRGTEPVQPAVSFPNLIIVASGGNRISIQDLSYALECGNRGAQVLCLEPKVQSTCRQHAMIGGVIGLESHGCIVEGMEYVIVRGQKPAFDTGAKAGIKLGAPAAAAAPAKGVWKLNVAADDDLMDEDDLLTEEDRKPAAAPAEDCSTSKKACANCSCGRAEAEAKGVKVELTQDMIENPQSACGSCGLGDAFRCATCPYRGLPSFEPGKKIQLPEGFLTADA